MTKPTTGKFHDDPREGYIIGRVWVGGRRVDARRNRWVAEKALGRPLRPDEDVHHLNGVRDDDRPENLQVLSASEHGRLTGRERSPLTVAIVRLIREGWRPDYEVAAWLGVTPTCVRSVRRTWKGV